MEWERGAIHRDVLDIEIAGVNDRWEQKSARDNVRIALIKLIIDHDSCEE